MKKTVLLTLMFTLAAFMSVSAVAQTATQTVNLDLQSILRIDVTPATLNLAISGGTTGSATLSAPTDNSTQYKYVHNTGSASISVQVSSALPTGWFLAATLAAPAGASSAGPVNLTTTPVDAVTGIARGAGSGLTVSYAFTADASQAAPATIARTVTFTIHN